MNKKDTEKAIQVMQAYVDGKTIINFCGMKGSNNPSPMWSWGDNAYTYTVKPEPIVRWIIEGKSRSADFYLTQEEYDSGKWNIDGAVKLVGEVK